MNEVQSRYRDAYDEFSSLLAYAVALIEAQAGHEPDNEREFYGERIFGKLVCHGMSLKRLSPSPPPVHARELWDVSSSYAIARTLIETYDALAYVAFELLEPMEREFRLSLWKLHAEERRAEMLRLIGSTEAVALQARVVELKQAMLAHPFLPQAGTELRMKLQKGEIPPYHLTQRERGKRAEIDRDYHRAVVMHLSSHVHTHPFSVYQLFQFQAGEPECLRLMSIPLQYSAAFLAKAIDGMIAIFHPRVPAVSPTLRRALDSWNELLRKGVKRAD
jgi:hypothetical protein